MNDAEKRIASRHRVKNIFATIFCEEDSPQGSSILPGRIEDINRHGMRMKLHDRITPASPQGDIFIVVPEVDEPIQVKGRIAWQENSHGTSSTTLGVRFNPSQMKASEIEEHILVSKHLVE